MQTIPRELEQLRTVSERMIDSVIACDSCGQILFVNSAAQALFGALAAEMNAMDDCPELMGLFDSHGNRLLEPNEMPLAQAAYEGRTVRANLIVRQDDTASPLEATAFPVLDPSGRQVGAMMVCRCLSSFPRC